MINTDTYGAKGMEQIEWKWLIGPLPLPKSTLVLIPASTNRTALPTALFMPLPCARLAAIAEAREQPVPWVFFDIK